MNEETNKTTVELLDEQIKGVLEDLEIAKFSEEQAKPLLDKLKTLCAQKEIFEKAARDQEKLDNDTAIRIKELELREENDKRSREIEEKKLNEQKKNNTLNVIIAGVGALTGIISLGVTVFLFKKGLTFEETGSYTAKTVQNIANVARIVKH